VTVALVGAGNWGKNLLRELSGLDDARVGWVCDRAEPALDAARAAHPGVLCTSDYKRVLTDASVEAVVVATDARSHYELASAALQANKHVFVEKPLTLCSKEAKALCATATIRTRTLMVGHIMLYHPAVRALRRMISEGELGDPLYIYARRLNFRAARSDESAWWSLAPHDIAVANAIFAANATSVKATGVSVAPAADPRRDVVFATINYPGGRSAQVHVSWLEPRNTRLLTVVCTRKTAIIDDVSPLQALSIFDTPRGVVARKLASREGAAGPTTELATFDRLEPLRRECADFIECIRHSRVPLAHGSSGLDVVRILEAGARSLTSNGEPVAVA
jgi:predicted dehydrogenase